ncbi:hypothetical protein DFJ74DRAFT_710705 [Hyaloraphidium curvatum]|nr:hypothetical protein DFJ74DRAFT_710705 [Hyaloraphidium curvatum]
MGPIEGIVLRGAAFASAGAILFGIPAVVRPRWERIVDLLGGEKATVQRIVFVTSFGTVLLGNLAMLPVYYANHPWFERFRSLKKDFPWRSEDPAKRAAFWKLFRRSLALTLFNNAALGYPIGLSMWDTRETKLPAGSFSAKAADFPGPLKIVLQVYFSLLVEDAFFYWSHRALHHPSWYPYIHKVHHQYKENATLAAENAHPVEFLLGNVIPVIAGPLVLSALSARFPSLRVHIFTVALWAMVRMVVSLDEHVGYTFPWSPVRALLPDVVRHEPAHAFHHSVNMGMYASQTGFWDWLCGTDRVFNEWMRKKAEGTAEEKDLTEGQA